MIQNKIYLYIVGEALLGGKDGSDLEELNLASHSILIFLTSWATSVLIQCEETKLINSLEFKSLFSLHS